MSDKNEFAINISAAKAKLSSLVESVINGQQIVIYRGGKPVVELIPYRKNNKVRKPGALEGKIDISDDFDELPKEFEEAFYISKE